MSLKNRLAPLLPLTNNWITLLGVFMVTTAGILFLFALPTYLSGEAASAYIGIILFLILPMLFFGGLALIPVGIWWWRKTHKDEPQKLVFPELTLKNPDLRKLLVFIGLATLANVVIGSTLTYRAIHHMESVQFCGTACHTVMKPEYTAYQNSPHSRVECVKCHIGPGANWFVKSKLSGAWQLVSVTFNLYPRPIPTPVENLRPARETCETCHWPEKYGADRLRVLTQFDDAGKMTKTVLLMHIGGGNLARAGIHGAHLAQGLTIRYAHADKGRQTIPWIEAERNGTKTVYTTKDFDASKLSSIESRTMDCMDCHNRPSHAYEMPERALNNAMAAGSIDSKLPEVKKRALEIIQKDYASTDEAVRTIPAAFINYYREKQGDVYQTRSGQVERSAQALLAIYERNVFPEMRVKWGSYPNNIGHTDFPGCFRCHDDEHKSKDGKSVSQDCSACHEMLAMEEEAPKVLTDLGLTPAAKTEK